MELLVERRQRMRSLTKHVDGNVAMLFAILIVPLIIAAGIGLDSMRTGEVRSELNEAADAGLLAAARAKLKDDTLTDDQLTVLARRHFDANKRSHVEIDTFEFDFDAATKAATLTARGRVRTAIMGVIGKPYMDLNILSEAKVAPPRILEAALVLDNTMSMDGAKMTALKDSAAELVDAIMADTDNTVKVAVVPFSQYVNVGMSRRDESWVNVPPDTSQTDWVCSDTYPNATSSNCRQETSTCMSDGVPYSCSSEVCDWDYGSPVNVCGWNTAVHAWRGCVGSRNHPLNVEDRDFGANRVPGLLDEWCPDELLPLTTDKAAVLAKIAGLYVQGDTYVPSGLTWGLRVLSPTAPFTEGNTYEETEAKAGLKTLVLMTDGANTRSANYPDHWGTDKAAADALTIELCDEIKSKKIYIHTIAFQVSDAGIESLLRNCASAPENYYDADDAAELADAFNSIGDDLKELALSK